LAKLKDKHIINLLENAPLAELGENELDVIKAHVTECEGCRHAYEAAQIASLLLKQRVAEAFEPSPFFQTRVLAEVREQFAEEGWSLIRLWRSAGALASAMAVTVATLGILTFMIPSNTGTQEMSSAYSPEAIILQQSELSDDQVLTTLYGADEDAVK
jgi:hypothetical protein